MNELIFFSHILLNVIFLFIFLRVGKTSVILYHALQIIIANLFVLKEVNLFGLAVTAADVYAIGALMSLTFIREYWGKAEALKTIWVAFLASFLFMIMGQCHLLYIPNSYDSTQNSYLSILSMNPRLVIASLITFLVTQRLDLMLYQTFRKKLNKSLAMTMFLCLMITNLLDTVLFSFLGLYGILHSLFSVILIAYIIKVIISIISTIAISFLNLDIKEST